MLRVFNVSKKLCWPARPQSHVWHSKGFVFMLKRLPYDLLLVMCELEFKFLALTSPTIF